MKQRLKILDIWVDAITVQDAEEEVIDILRHATRPHSVFASNPEKNFSVPADPELYAVYGNADILLPDGIGMVLAARILHRKKIDRIPGVEFMQTICRVAASENRSVYIYGAKEDVNRKAVERLETEISGLRIAGRNNGYVRDADMLNLIRKINESKASVLFLALGSPRQEKWFTKFKGLLDHVVLVQGIGGTLDAIAGNVKRAPRLFCRLNLEWFYRLLKQPHRAGRQRVLPLFALQIVMQKMKSRG